MLVARRNPRYRRNQRALPTYDHDKYIKIINKARKRAWETAYYRDCIHKTLVSGTPRSPCNRRIGLTFALDLGTLRHQGAQVWAVPCGSTGGSLRDAWPAGGCAAAWCSGRGASTSSRTTRTSQSPYQSRKNTPKWGWFYTS